MCGALLANSWRISALATCWLAVWLNARRGRNQCFRYCFVTWSIWGSVHHGNLNNKLLPKAKSGVKELIIADGSLAWLSYGTAQLIGSPVGLDCFPENPTPKMIIQNFLNSGLFCCFYFQVEKVVKNQKKINNSEKKTNKNITICSRWNFAKSQLEK